MAAKSSNKVIIPISFVDEKNSLNTIKNNLLDLQKSLIGGQGKNFLGSIIPEVNDSIKAINKAMAQFNKPVSSKKAAGALGQNLTSSFYNLNSIISKVQKKLDALWDPKAATIANNMIQESGEELERLLAIRDRWSKLNSKVRQTGNEAQTESALKQTRKEKKEILDTKEKTPEQIARLKELIALEKEYETILKEKAKLKNEIKAIEAESGFGDMTSLNKAINDYMSINKEATNDSLLQTDYLKISEALQNILNTYLNMNGTVSNFANVSGEMWQEQIDSAQIAEQKQQKLNQTLRQTLGIGFGLNDVIRAVKKLIREAFDFYKSLDRALTDITIVSDMSRSQVQELTQEFIKLSAQTGMAIDDIAKASVIFFQQGLSTKEVMEMTEVTAQFAKVAGSTVEKAADQLTAAVNGFQVGVEGAIDVADKLNAVAAKSAASIDEIATAMSKAASQANQAGLSMDKFYAILATMEEVTREAPENIGTSMKTIMARMQQIKEGNNTEDETDVNDVETALKTVGISLREANGQLRDLEDVLDELGPKWNSLDRNTQAYLGTIIAGTRQQSRFISMMQNWDRVLELTAVSENSAGQQALMHEKAMQGLDAAINTLTNSWQKFLTTLTNSDIFISILNTLSTIIQNLTKEGAALNLVVIGLSAIFIKFNTNLKEFALKVERGFAKFKLFATEIKKSNGTFKDFIKNMRASKDNIKKLAEAYNTSKSALEELMIIEAQRNNLLPIGNNNTKMTKDELDKEVLSIRNSNMAIEEQNVALAKLAARLGITQTQLSLLTMDEASFKEKMTEANNAVDANGKALAKAQGGYQGILSTFTMVITAIEAITTALGGSNKAWVQLLIGIAAMVGVVVAAFSKGHKELLASGNGLYAIISMGALALTGIVAFINGLKSLTSDGTEDLNDLKEKSDELNNSIQATSTKIKSIEENLGIYDKLSKKMVKTKEEQEKLNDAIMALHDLTGAEVIDNGDGTYGLKRSDAKAKLDEYNEELEQKQVEYSNIQFEKLEQSAKVAKRKQRSVWKDIGDIALGTLTMASGNPVLMTAGGAKIADTIKKIKEAKKEGRKQAFTENIDGLINAVNDFVKLESTKDANGKVIASATDKSDLQDAIKKNIIKSYEQAFIDGKIDEKELEKKVQEDAEKYKKFFEFGKGKLAFEKAAQSLNQIKETSNTKTYDEVKKEVDAIFDGLMTGLDTKSEEYKKLAELKKAEMASIWDDDDFDFDTLIKQFAGKSDEYSKAMSNILHGATGSLASTLNNIGLFDGSSQAKEIATYFTPEMINTIQEGYRQGAAQGNAVLTEELKKISDTLHASGASEQIINYVTDMMNKIDVLVESKSFVSWGEDIRGAAEPLETINNVLDELNENGEITWDTFSNLLALFDEMMRTLSGDELDNFLNAVSQMDFQLNENTGNIIANKDAMKSMKDMTILLAKAKLIEAKRRIDAQIASNEATLSQLKNDRDATKSALDAAEAEAGAGKYVCEETEKAENAKVDMTYNAGQKMVDITKNVHNKQAEIISSPVNKRINSSPLQAPSSRNKQNVSTVNNNYSTNKVDGLRKKYQDILDNIERVEKEQGALKSMSAWLDDLIKADWSKFGTGKNGKKASKTLKEYVSKLKEMLDIITHIERETAKLNAFKSIYDKQTGKAAVENLRTQIQLVEHLQEDYLKAFNINKEATNKLKDTLSQFNKVISFNKEGSYSVNKKAYNKLTDKQKENLDNLLAEYDEAVGKTNDYYNNLLDKMKEELDLRQQVIDKYIEAENKLVEAIKSREKKILDAKLEAVDKEIEAIGKVSEARRKAREEENDAAEMSGLQVDLQRALMDSSGASASQILSLQKQIKDKQKEMADNSFDDMVNDMKQQLEDEKEMEQALFDERLEEMDWYWAEVDRIMGEGVQSVLDTMKLYSDEYNQASELQQHEVLDGWKNTFEQAVYIGKESAQTMQSIIDEILSNFNNIDIKEAMDLLNSVNVTAPGMGIKTQGMTVNGAYASGGMNYKTGLAWLDGTRSNPEAVLNSAQTKAFLSFTDDLAALRASGAITNNSNVIIDTISFNVESMSSPEDGEKAFDAFVDRFKQIGAKQGISINGTANRF